MIDYSAITESSAVIFTIYFLVSGSFLNDENKYHLRLYAYKNYLIFIFIAFSITMILSSMELYCSIFTFIIPTIILGYSLNYLMAFYYIKYQEILRTNLFFISSPNFFNNSGSFNISSKTFSITLDLK